VKIRIVGGPQLEAKYNRRASDVRSMMHTATAKAVTYVHSTVPPYPPEPPMSTYRRTGLLGRSIATDVRTIGAQSVGIIGTDTVYAPWVISDRAVGNRGPQAKVHKGRWYTLQGVVNKAWSQVVQIYRDAFRKAIQ
jgi:hypothetical protein